MKANLKGMVQPRFLDTLTVYLTMKHAKSKARNDAIAVSLRGKETSFLWVNCLLILIGWTPSHSDLVIVSFYG